VNENKRKTFYNQKVKKLIDILLSMQVGTENHREFAGRKNDPRITRVGKILRVSRFDEIPQLWG